MPVSSSSLSLSLSLNLDEVDKRILNIILKNSRLSFRQISKAAGISVATAINRIKILEKKGVIKKYSTILDYEKSGYDIEVIVEMRISKGKLLDVEKKIASHPNVFAVYDHTGQTDATIIARFKNRRAMDTFVKKIQTYDFVERTETRLILNTIKEEPQLLS